MLHSTTTTSQPSTKSLLYITTFARMYTPDAHNESLARSLAQKFSNDINDDSYKQLSWTKLLLSGKTQKSIKILPEAP